MNDTTTAVAAPQERGTLTLAEVIRHVELVERVLREVMKEGTHFGESFPGDKKKNLLKPGADKLCLAFGLAPSFVLHEREFENGHREYRFTCVLTTANGRIMGEGVGSCSTLEKKYRYRSDKRKCPECGKEAIIKGKKEYGGGWLCFAKKDGCGAKWPDGAAEIEQQQAGQVENPDIADVYNTCLKIAKKRAYVDATITATAASDLFTQDIEDLQDKAEQAEHAEFMTGERLRERHQQAEQTQEQRREAPKAHTATASPTATPTGSKTTSATADESGQRMQDAYKRVQTLIGAKAAACVWKAYGKDNQRVERLAALQSLVTSCETILKTVGADEGGNIIQNEVDAAGNDQMKPTDAVKLVERLAKAANGEVTP